MSSCVQLSRSLGVRPVTKQNPLQRGSSQFFLTKNERNLCKDGGAISLFWYLFELLLVLRQHGDKGLTQLNSTPKKEVTKPPSHKKKKNTHFPTIFPTCFSPTCSPCFPPFLSLRNNNQPTSCLGFPNIAPGR